MSLRSSSAATIRTVDLACQKNILDRGGSWEYIAWYKYNPWWRTTDDFGRRGGAVTPIDEGTDPPLPVPRLEPGLLLWDLHQPVPHLGCAGGRGRPHDAAARPADVQVGQH